jgi:predicted nucleotidyltransferase
MKTTEEYLSLLRQYKAAHAKEYGIERMGIFGSVARGEHTEESDVDIYYEGPSLGLKSFGLEREIEEFLGVRIDLIRRHNNIRPRFMERIMKDIIYV